MVRQVGRFEDLDIDGRAGGVDDQGGESEFGAPPCLDELAVHVALQPATVGFGEVVMVGSAGSEGAIGGEPVVAGEGSVHRTSVMRRAAPGPCQVSRAVATAPIVATGMGAPERAASPATDTDAPDLLLHENYRLTHMTGCRQSRQEC